MRCYTISVLLIAACLFFGAALSQTTTATSSATTTAPPPSATASTTETAAETTADSVDGLVGPILVRPKPTMRNYNVDAVVKLRCSLTSTDETIFFFNGTVIGYPTQQLNRVLFKTVGMNIGRCFKNADGSYTLASREVLLYLDPATEALLQTWTNPWTNQVVNVVHVDNDPVIQTFPATAVYPMMEVGDNTIYATDIPLYYPNPLGNNPTYVDYSPQTFYQAGEFFKFIVPTAELKSTSRVKTTSSSIVSWTRTGPWLPWMKQGANPGYLMYSSQGDKVKTWRDLQPIMVEQIKNRIPQYKTAPSCIPNTRSVTSWTYFASVFQQYLAGAQFPLTTPAVYPCL